MPIVTADGITTPDFSEPYDYVSQMATMATTIQSALEKRGNSYRGTATQREAFRTTAPEGTLWSDTNGDKALYIKRGASWARIWPETDTGWVSSNFLASQSGWRTHPDAPGVSRIRRVGDWVFISWVVQRTGNAVSVPSSGNISNLTAAILKPEWRPSTWQPVGTGETGPVTGWVISSSGHIRLNAVGGTANIGKNSGLSLRGWYRMNF